MQRIVLPVEDKVALLWEQAAPDRRAQIVSLFSWLLEKEDWQRFSQKDFARLLDQISEKAQTNGLTLEILEEILNEP